GDGNDVITGSAGNDEIDGEDGNDVILGEAGTDILHGGIGDDVLLGGLGDDSLTDDDLASGNDILDGGGEALGDSCASSADNEIDCELTEAIGEDPCEFPTITGTAGN